MSLRATLTAAVSAGLAGALLAAPGPALAADGVDPTDDGTLAGLFDPVVEVLPPIPVPHTPYVGPTCTDGSPDCIDATIERMEKRLAGLAESCHHESVFSLAYLRVTEDVRAASDEGYYDDPVWLAQVDAVFAEQYFDAMAAWDAGNRAAVPQAWRIALQAAEDRSVSGLGNFMLAMNAHINRDFSYVLAEVGLTGPDGTSHKADHNAYNTRLDALYAPVFAEEAARFDPTFDDIDAGPLEETAAGAIMRGWREMVWRNAEQLVLAKNPLQRLLARQVIENYATTQALLIRQVFAIPNSTKRDAWCAEHGRG